MAGISLSQRALTTARFGKMRFGAFRFGFIPKDLQTGNALYGWTRIYPLASSWTRVFPLLLALFLGACAHTAKVIPTATVAAPQKPYLTLRASPQMGLPPLRVLLTAEIKGEETDTFYCPEIAWLWPNETVSTEGGDCTPFEQRDDFQRRWTRGVTLGVPGRWTFWVELRKSGRVIAREPVTVEVAGSGQ